MRALKEQRDKDDTCLNCGKAGQRPAQRRSGDDESDESGDDDGEAVVLRAPGVRLVLQGHEVGPGDDEAVGAHGVLQTLAGDVSL